MKKRIRITESQLAEIAKRMDETVFSTDANGQSVASTVQKFKTEPGNAGKIKTGDTLKFDASGTQDGKTLNPNGGNTSIEVELAESSSLKKITKKEIKEARLNKLVKESVRMFKKKNLVWNVF